MPNLTGQNWRLTAAPAGAALCGALAIILGLIGHDGRVVSVGVGLIVVTAALFIIGKLTGRL